MSAASPLRERESPCERAPRSPSGGSARRPPTAPARLRARQRTRGTVQLPSSRRDARHMRRAEGRAPGRPKPADLAADPSISPVLRPCATQPCSTAAREEEEEGTHLGRGVAVVDVGGDTGGEADVVQRQVRHERVELEEERQRLADTACGQSRERVSHGFPAGPGGCVVREIGGEGSRRRGTNRRHRGQRRACC